MASITQQPIPTSFVSVFDKAGLKIKKYESSASFENDLRKFLKRNHVLHLSTCKDNVPRSTPLEYRLHDLKFYVFSEGGAKFNNLKHNNRISFSIAEPYNSEEDYFSNKGVQAWGTAKVFYRDENRQEFENAFKLMNIKEVLKQLGAKELPPGNYRIIEITPNKIKYTNPREGVFRVTWEREK